MRLRHLSWIPRPEAWPGVLRRLAEQARAAQDLGLDLRFTVLCRDGGGIRDGVELLPITVCGSRLSRCRAIAHSRAFDDCDAAVLRYPTAVDLGIGGLLDRHGHHLITEHHTDEAAEYRTINPGPVGWLRSAIERRRKPTFLARVAGIVAVTEELRRLESAAAPGRPSTVIGNGIDVSAQAAHGPAAADSQRLRIFWACSTFASWHGLDRMLAALARRHAGAAVELHLAGRLDPSQKLAITACQSPHLQVTAHGSLGPTALDQVMRSCHIAIGCLALHRKGMTEACPLKVREAVARGMPIAIAYHDPDLPDSLPGIIRLPPGEAPIDGEAFVTAALAAAADRGIVDRLRHHAETHLDWRPKLRAMADFAARVVNR